MKNSIFYKVIELVSVAVSLILCIGVQTLFGTCGKSEDGTFMSCHWAGLAVFGVACVILVLSIVNLLVRNTGISIGLSVGILLNALLAALIPGRLISTCMMADMRCNAVTKPAVMVCCLIIAVTKMIGLAISFVSIRREKQA